MFNQLVIGAVASASLFMSSGEVTEPIISINKTNAVPVNIMINEPVELKNMNELMMFRTPAVPESEDSANTRKHVLNELEAREAERADLASERLTEAKKERIIKEWEENFPIIEGDSQQATFINTISKDSVEIARDAGIYPSVMIAQAGLESKWGTSGLAINYNNLMGTKGSWNGKTIEMRTREDIAGESIYIDAGFSVYDSWEDSLKRYGQLLLNGPNGNYQFYSGAWRKNTMDYQDATAWLEGRYATDSQYADKLNKTIETYGLSAFDDITALEENLKDISVSAQPEDVSIVVPEGIYEVKSGDTLFSIAMNEGVTLKELEEWNSLESLILEEKQWLVLDETKDKVSVADILNIDEQLVSISSYNN